MKLFALLPAIAAGVVLSASTAPARGLGHAVRGGLQGGVLLYAAGGGNVAIYEALEQGHREIGTLQGFSNADALTVDSAHNVYVGDAGAQKIYVYARNSFFPFRILDDPQGGAVALAVGPDGTVYAANEMQSSYAGNIVLYAPGATKPTSTLMLPPSEQNLLYAIALDSQGNLFVRYDTEDYSYNLTQHLAEFVVGSSQPQSVPIGLIKESQGSGIAFDAAGDLLVSDPAIVVYDLSRRLFKRFFGAGIALAFDHSRRRLFSADPTAANIYEYAYPSGKLLDSLSKTPTSALAVDPPASQ